MEKTSLAQFLDPFARVPRILIVEDDITSEALWTHLIRKIVPSAELTWMISEEGAERCMQAAAAAGENYDLVISDVYLAGSRTGIDHWRRYGASGTLFLLVSAMTPRKFQKLLGEDSPAPIYLQKPFQPRQGEELVSALLSLRDFVP